MEQQVDNVAGLDVHRDSVVACVRLGRGDDPQVIEEEFKTTTAGVGELARLAGRLRGDPGGDGVDRGVLEAGLLPLEGLFAELWLVNAHHVKNVPGRKTDMADAEWLADVAAHGMVRPSFVPPPPVRELRELTRYRKTQVDHAGPGDTAPGQGPPRRRDQDLLGRLDRAGQVHSGHDRGPHRRRAGPGGAGRHGPRPDAPEDRPPSTEALAGRFGAHHGAVARAILDHIDFLDAAIARLDQEVAARLGPFGPRSSCWRPSPGWAAGTAEVIVAETGADMARFPTAEPPRRLGRGGAGQPRVGRQAPTGRHPPRRQLAAPCPHRGGQSGGRTKGTYLAAQYRQIAARRGPNKATVAVAHSILVAAWHMLSTGTTYHDLGADYFAPGATPSARPAASSPASKPSATKSPSPQPP